MLKVLRKSNLAYFINNYIANASYGAYIAQPYTNAQYIDLASEQ